MDTIHGYEVTQMIQFSNMRGMALAHNSKAVDPFVTWQFTEENGKRDYYWGHYFKSDNAAQFDLIHRANEYQKRYGEVIANMEPSNSMPARYCYYSTQRPVDIGTFPKSSGNAPVWIQNFDERKFVQNDTIQAWGELAYALPLTQHELYDYELKDSPDNPDTFHPSLSKDESSLYRPALSSHTISMKLADCFEDAHPKEYPATERAQTLRAIRDILHGRTDKSIPHFLAEAREQCGADYGERLDQISKDIDTLMAQRVLRSLPYDKSSSKDYAYQYMDIFAERSLKIIDQFIFDDAAKAGFPPGFFRESYFDHVTFYCLPDHSDFTFSRFADCTFAVCRIHNATFDGTSLHSCAFHEVDMQNTTFFQSTLAYTHFYDSTITKVSFQKALLNRCNTIACELESINFLQTILDACSFDKVRADKIRNLDTAIITMGGATETECAHNKNRIYEALQSDADTPKQEARHKTKLPHKREDKGR